MGVLKVQAQQRNPLGALPKRLERNHFGPGNACTGRGLYLRVKNLASLGPAAMSHPTIAENSIPLSWTRWFERGWHNIRVSEWLNGYLQPKLEAELAFLAELKRNRPGFSRVNQRMEREVVGDLVRSQHHLPWHTKSRDQFFR